MLILNRIQILTLTILPRLFLTLIPNSLVLIEIASALHFAADVTKMTLLE